MRFVVQCVAGLSLVLGSHTAFAEHPEPAEVMMFGAFHFANPGADVVKTDQINVMTEENQAYLEALADRISEFNPTVVLLEFPLEREPVIQERFRDYVNGEFELPSNEIYQLGFRIAAMSDADTVYGYDEQNVHWQPQAMWEYMKTSDPKADARRTALIKELTRKIEEEHRTLSLQELLQLANDPDRDAMNRGLYIMTNPIGDGENFVGADATSTWWHRNFRMYAIVQRYAQPGERVLVIGGQGHTAILRQLLSDDSDRRAVDVTPYL